ncbi:MAG: GNAT family N-acetyltransferase [Defluviitaleaceae bacterium]|nr:GNAT family N-acetyltransferase [Defluviitaleaceae bacterium]
METGVLTQAQIRKGSELLSRIRTDEGYVLSDCASGETNYCIMKFFDDGENAGVFLSLIYFGSFRIFIAFDKDTGKFSNELAELVRESIRMCPGCKPRLYFIAEHIKTIDALHHILNFNHADRYASHEFIMGRENFKGFENGRQLEIKKFESDKIADYARLLDEAMTFVSPSVDFQGDLNGFAKRVNNVKENAFYTFYQNGELVGLYWLDNDFYTIDVMAVAPVHQRRGYGGVILSHAINNVLIDQKQYEAKLYCVDRNAKGIAFYKKYGMILKGHLYAVGLAED